MNPSVTQSGIVSPGVCQEGKYGREAGAKTASSYCVATYSQIKEKKIRNLIQLVNFKVAEMQHLCFNVPPHRRRCQLKHNWTLRQISLLEA